MRVEVPTMHGPVPAVISGPGDDAPIGIVLAHGAGAGIDHPWMVGLRERLAGRGFVVLAFDYAYMAQGRKAPDRLPKLLDVHEAAVGVLAERVGTTVLAGKSMGGRVGGHLVAERGAPVDGLVYLGYPLVAMGAREPRPTSHLTDLDVPQLFISGDRDALGPVDLVADVAASVPTGRFVVIESGDHSLTPLKRSGRTIDDTLDEAVAVMATWIDECVAQDCGGT
jgi:predicted alpha/beta-hydrolase family hydrolase